MAANFYVIMAGSDEEGFTLYGLQPERCWYAVDFAFAAATLNRWRESGHLPRGSYLVEVIRDDLTLAEAVKDTAVSFRAHSHACHARRGLVCRFDQDPFVVDVFVPDLPGGY